MRRQVTALYEHELPHVPQLLFVVRSVSQAVTHVPRSGGQATQVPPVHSGVLPEQSALVQHWEHALLPEHTVVPAGHATLHTPAAVHDATSPPLAGHAPAPHDCEQPVLGSFGPSAVHVAPHRWNPDAHVVQPGPAIPAGQPASWPVPPPVSCPLLPPVSAGAAPSLGGVAPSVVSPTSAVASFDP